MGVKIKGEYLGNKQVKLCHGDSGFEIVTDAPKDNGGEGRAFSPTDLLASALGSCILTTLSLFAERKAIVLKRMSFEVEKVMSDTPPRRITRLPIAVHLPNSLTPEERTLLERVAVTCPVHKSLHPEIECKIDLVFDLM
jgi:uncharacterized OsmC-like protein